MILHFLIGLILLSNITSIGSKDYYSILGVSETASDLEIRKAYRRLALEYHPDKIHLTEILLSEEEKERIKQHFLDIQDAYDIIGDPENRLAYDLKRGSHGDQIVDADEVVIEHYKLFPFSLFVRTKQISLAFSIKVSRPEPIPIRITLYVDVSSVFTGLSSSHKYFRRTICDVCHGNGGVNGTCRKCSLCDGLGHANHLFHDQSTCGTCLGKGCLPEGKCSHCSGKGVVMTESLLTYNLIRGFQNGAQLIFQGLGHMTTDGRIGNVELKVVYQFPLGWRQIENTLDLYFSVHVDLETLANGWSESLFRVNGKSLEVNVDGLSLVEILEEGIFIHAEGYGLVDDSGKLGNLVVEIIPSWENMTFPLWIELLQASEIEPDSRYFLPLMRLYFMYANHTPRDDDWIILQASYSNYQWNNTNMTQDSFDEKYSDNHHQTMMMMMNHDDDITINLTKLKT